MSWQSYVDQSLLGTNAVKQAAILGAADGSIWAASAGFAITPGEGKAIVKMFANPEKDATAGAVIAGTKYMYIGHDKNAQKGYTTIRIKKGAGGGTLAKSKQAIIVALYDETIQPGNCNMVTEKLTDYLWDNNY